MMFRLNRKMGILTLSMILLFGNLSVKAEDDKLEFVAENVTVFIYYSNGITLSSVKNEISIENPPPLETWNPNLDNKKICEFYESIKDNKADDSVSVSLEYAGYKKYKNQKLKYDKCEDFEKTELKDEIIIISFKFKDSNIEVEYDGASLRLILHFEKVYLDDLMYYMDNIDKMNNDYNIMRRSIERQLNEALTFELKKDVGDEWERITTISYPQKFYEKNGKCQGVECSEYLRKKYENSDWKIYEMAICHGGLCWIQLHAGSRNIFIVEEEFMEESGYPKDWDQLRSYVMFKQVEWLINEQKSVLTERRESLKKMNEGNRHIYSDLSIYKEEINELVSTLYFCNRCYFVLDIYLEDMKNKNLVDDVLIRYERLKHDIEIGKAEIPVLISQYQAKQTIKIFVWAVFITLIIGILSILISICFSKSTFKDIRKLEGIVEAMDEKTSNVVLILGDMQAKLKSTYSRKSKKSEKKRRKAK